MHFFTDVTFVFFSVQPPVPTLLGAICRNVSCFPTVPANFGVTFATFLLSFSSFLASRLGPPSRTIRSFFTLAAVKYFWTLQLGPCPSFHPPLACTLLALRVQRVFPYPSSSAPSPSVPAAMPKPSGALVCARVNVLRLGCPRCRDLFFDDVLQRDEQLFVWWCHRIDSSADSRALTFSLPESSLRLGFFQTSSVLVRLVDEVPEDFIELLQAFLHDHVR